MALDPTSVPDTFRRSSLDPDDAKDLAEDYLADKQAQYDDYVSWCREEGIAPKPFENDSK